MQCVVIKTKYQYLSLQTRLSAYEKAAKLGVARTLMGVRLKGDGGDSEPSVFSSRFRKRRGEGGGLSLA